MRGAQACDLCGPSLCQYEIRRLGTPYYSTKDEGTGLGMMVVYSLVKAMNGEIKVQSEKGKGTEFTLSFPLEAAPKMEAEFEMTPLEAMR